MADQPDVEAVYARAKGQSVHTADPLTLAQKDGAGIVIRGSYYLSGDSVLFQAGIIDVASGRTLRSFDPVGAPVERVTDALEALRERIARGLGPLVSRPLGPVDPDLDPPSLPAYREFVTGIKEGEVGDWAAETEHYRRAARLDSTFVAPLIQLAFDAIWNDECTITDSVGTVLDQRREQLTQWDRLTIDVLRARCRGDRVAEVRLLKQRFGAYPQSAMARGTYATKLCKIPISQGPLGRSCANGFPGGTRRRNCGTGSDGCDLHMPGEYSAELDITDRWRDSPRGQWQMVRGRALAALGRERELRELLRVNGWHFCRPGRASSSSKIATELAVHGHHQRG